MKKIFRKEQLQELMTYPKEVITSIKEAIDLLDGNYGENRNVENELGGYIVIIEKGVDVNIVKDEIVKGVIAEYTDMIKCSEGVNYTSSLFLLSSDYAIVVVTTEELSKFLLE